MRLEDIQFADEPEIVARKIIVKGSDVEAFFRVLNAERAQKIAGYGLTNEGKIDRKKAQDVDFKWIAAVCCKADGTDLYTEEQARKLPAPVKIQLYTVATEVNTPQTEGTPGN